MSKPVVAERRDPVFVDDPDLGAVALVEAALRRGRDVAPRIDVEGERRAELRRVRAFGASTAAASPEPSSLMR